MGDFGGRVGNESTILQHMQNNSVNSDSNFIPSNKLTPLKVIHPDNIKIHKYGLR